MSNNNNGNDSNFKPLNVKGRSAPSWFDDEEYNLQLNTGASNSNDSSNNDGSSSNSSTDNGDTTNSNTTNDTNTNENNNNNNNNNPSIVNGKLIVNKQDLANGIRVGSAGGWSLEVFPGDFVVHRKYGIGRYDQTIIKPKTKLTKEEQRNQKLRRNEIVKDLLANRKEKKMDASEIEAIVKNFGTDKDLDNVSNPMQTVLEVAYGDAIVHIPVDKAYRLSRYRAGDAVVKPRLSRVKGEAWRKAKKKVEEDTIQMAQDVLALYATRETLTRTPFDPTKEGR